MLRDAQHLTPHLKEGWALQGPNAAGCTPHDEGGKQTLSKRKDILAYKKMVPHVKHEEPFLIYR
ncbi:hypothetical protein KDA_63970 [Dictyobacter alpinus]|uniref:Uncharacterized protein n=1 Tax=Dictyobacter alpinus TaxID=2014873 RepID=A0A402BHQ9_9CHLR|nr:hypothetical protein KDA_63970 [Dictyobacter alpinus]